MHQRKSIYNSQHTSIHRKSLKNNTALFSSVYHFEVEKEEPLRQSDGLKIRNSQSVIDRSKIDQGKTFLKGKARDSFRR
jgi:hypothetical protein